MMAYLAQFVVIALLAATARSDTLYPVSGRHHHHQLFSRENIRSGNAACDVATEGLCYKGALKDDGRACDAALCGAACLAAQPQAERCCAYLPADSDKFMDCYILNVLLADDYDGTSTAGAGAGAATGLSTSTAFDLGSSSTSAHPGTGTTGTAVHVSSGSGVSGTTTPSSLLRTSPTLSTSGASNASAAPSTPTGNVAAEMGVAPAGALGSVMVWAMGVLML